METVSSWVISIAGICTLSVLVDLFLPEGQMCSIIKTVFNFSIILVVISPLPNLLNQNVNSIDFVNNQIVLQEDYIYQVNRDKLTFLEENIENSLKDKGLQNIDISISADIFTTNMVIETIYVDLSNLVIESNSQHINIKNEVVDVINSFIKIDEKGIVFSG